MMARVYKVLICKVGMDRLQEIEQAGRQAGRDLNKEVYSDNPSR